MWRAAVGLCLASCASPTQATWVQADGAGHPLEGMDDCPGVTCDLDVIDLRKKEMVWVPAGELAVPVVIDVDVSGRSPVFGGLARFTMTPDVGADVESSDPVTCRVQLNQMWCDPAFPSWVQRSVGQDGPSGLYLNAGGVYADDALEGD